MKSWFVLILLLCGAALYYVAEYHPDWLKRVAGGEVVEKPLYRWTDAQGQVVYGTEVPHGRRGERVDAQARMSVVPANAAVGVAAPVPAAGASAAADLKHKLVDRAVEGRP